MLKYLGPDSPWGPAIAGMLCALTYITILIASVVVLAPPIIWVLTGPIILWWQFWLGAQ